MVVLPNAVQRLYDAALTRLAADDPSYFVVESGFGGTALMAALAAAHARTYVASPNAAWVAEVAQLSGRSLPRVRLMRRTRPVAHPKPEARAIVLFDTPEAWEEESNDLFLVLANEGFHRVVALGPSSSSGSSWHARVTAVVNRS